MNKKKRVLLLVLFLFSLICYAQPKDRPSVALVLGGGGAKGFAEIPVLEMLEKMDIPIDIIVGTSFGSVVGGLYSAGYSIQEIYSLIDDIEWSPLFSDYEVSPYESILGNHSLYNNMINLTFGLDMSLRLGKGVSNGQNVYQMLKKLTLKYPSNMDFDNLYIPFRPVTTDMLNGEAVIIDHGDLAEAIRASMSIPGIFEPCEIDGHYYMDGGLRYNLPINIAKDLGYDIIIAIDISQQIRANPEVYDSNPAVAILNTITISQATITQSMLQDADLVICPDMTNFSTFDFKKVDAIYEQGRIAAEQAKDKMEEVRKRIYPEDYDENGKRLSDYRPMSVSGKYRRLPNFIPQKLVIKGAYEQDEIYIKNSFNKICNKEINTDTFNSFMQDVYLTGNYKSILPRVFDNAYGENGPNTTLELILKKKELKEARISLNANLNQTISSSFSTVANLMADVQLRGLTGIGSVISFSATTITDQGISLFYMQPFNPYVFLQIDTTYYQDRYPTITRTNLNSSNYKSFTNWRNTLLFGVRTNNGNLIKIGGFVNTSSTYWGSLLSDQFYIDYVEAHKNDEAINMNKKLNGQCLGGFIDYSLNLQDRLSFAHSGMYVNLNAKVICPFSTKGFENPSLLTSLNFKGSIPLGNSFSINPGFFLGTDILQNGMNNISIVPTEFYSNYDRVFFPQISNKTTFGINKFAGTISCQFEPWEQLTILGGDVFLRLSASVGRLTYNLSDMFPKTEDMRERYPVLWSTSLGSVLKIREGLDVLVRLGLGSTNEKKFTPFFSIDIGSFS